MHPTDMENPLFKECPCQLCDCGRHKCHWDCLKKPVLAQSKNRRGWLSHYKATYICPPTVQPRSSKRPPCTPPHPNPPPMDLQTTQQTAFMAWDPKGQHPTEIKGSPHQLPWEPSRRQAPRSHCHSWPPTSPPGKRPPRLVNYTSPSNQCSLGRKKEESNLSENALVFGERQGGIATSLQPTQAGYVTKYQSDFPPQRSFPGKAAPALPPLDNLAINQTFSTSFKTIQRESYRQWDTSAYSHAIFTPQKERLGRERGEKFGGDPATKLTHLFPASAKGTESFKRSTTQLRSPTAKFDDTTAYKFFFRDWGARPRIRHGDPWERLHIHSLSRRCCNIFEYLPSPRMRKRTNCLHPHLPALSTVILAATLSSIPSLNKRGPFECQTTSSTAWLLKRKKKANCPRPEPNQTRERENMTLPLSIRRHTGLSHFLSIGSKST